MNRICCRLSVALLIVTIAPAQSLDAQEDAPKKENRIAVVNFATVLVKYEKAKIIKLEMDKLLDPFRKRAEKLKSEMQKLKEQQAVEANPDVQTVLLDAFNNAKRQLESLDQEANAKVGKRQQEIVVSLYKEIHAAIKQHAEQHGIQVVLGFGEPPQNDELFAYTNVNRKLTALDTGSVSMVYFQPDLDISMQVVDRLNQALKRAAGVK